MYRFVGSPPGKEVEQFQKLVDAYSADHTLGDVEEVSDVSVPVRICGCLLMSQFQLLRWSPSTMICSNISKRNISFPSMQRLQVF